MWGYGLDSSASREGQDVGSGEYGNEALGSIKFKEFLNLVQNDYILQMPAGPWS
jgi:hypothetical protein